MKTAASSISENSGNPEAERRKRPHNFYLSSAVVSHMDKVYSIVRKTYDRGPTDGMEDLDVKAAICGLFMKPLFKQQFILVRTMIRVYDLLRIISGVL